MDRRSLLIGAGLGTFSTALPLLAQQTKVSRIGILSARSPSTPSNPEPYLGAFVEGMRDLGYVEGKNLAIEWRYAEGKQERLPALASELVNLKPQVIVVHTTYGGQALQRLTSTIPIVVTSVIDPVGSGLVKSLARPGGNITGLTISTVDVSPKLMDLLKLALPSASRIAVLINPANASHVSSLKSIQAAGQAKGVRVESIDAGSLEEIQRAFEKIARDRFDAVILPAESLYSYQRSRIAELGIKYRVPTLFQDRVGVAAGCLLSYGPNTADSYRRAATYVDKILKGAKPGELPIEQPTTFYLAVNRKTANALGIRLPQELIGRADEIIE